MTVLFIVWGAVVLALLVWLVVRMARTRKEIRQLRELRRLYDAHCVNTHPPVAAIEHDCHASLEASVARRA